MRAQNLIGCAAFAFVGKRAEIGCRNGEKISGPTLDRKSQLQLPSLKNDDGRGDFDIDFRDNTSHGQSHERRSFFNLLSKSILASSLLVGNSKPAGAACLGGDIRAECIGIYKIPIDGMESKYVETPEMLKLYAPDIKWVPPAVYPPNYADALDQLKQQRPQLDIAQGFVAKGDLENAGLVILDIIPKVKAACIVMITAFGKASNNERNAAMKRKNKVIGNDGNPSSTPLVIDLEMKAYRIDDALNELMGCLGEIDILIGQGMRGDLGALTPAQIAILSNFPDCRREFDALLRAVPEKVSS